MSNNISIELKRLIRKYEFFLEDWEDIREISNIANQGMSAELHKHSPPDIKPSDFEEESIEEKPKRESEKADIPLKKLFRKIVVKCHPDKLSNTISESHKFFLLDLYDKAIEAHDSHNWALMVIIAVKLDVKLPEEAEDMIKEISDEVSSLESKIQDTMDSPSWKWYHSDEETKQLIVEQYLNLLQKKKKEFLEKNAEKKSKLVLGVGHPRTGTGYTAKLLQSWGLDVGHEKMGKHGTIDWSLSASKKSLWQDVDFKEYDWNHIIYCVRDPRESIASIAYTENIEGPSVRFRTKNGLNLMGNRIVDAIQSIILWDEMIENLEPSFVYRIEDQSKDLFNYLKEHNIDVNWNEDIIGKPQNTREHKTWKELIEESEYIGNLYKKKINKYCMKYGYNLLF